jgi:hypothetical protein
MFIPSRHLQFISFLILIFRVTHAQIASPQPYPVVFKGPKVIEAKGVHNIHIEYTSPVDGELSIVYGACNIHHPSGRQQLLGTTYVGSHLLAKRHAKNYQDNRPTRFVWLPPADINNGGCLHAFSGNELLGRSAAISVTRRHNRRGYGEGLADIADSYGPWFDAVEHLSRKEPNELFVSQTKTKKIGIVGAGISGLMTGVGFLAM